VCTGRHVTGRLCRYIADREEAYDLLQECFISIYRKIELYDPDRRFSTWAFQIALNKCRDWGRKNSLRRPLPFSALDKTGDDNGYFLENIADPGASPEDILSDRRELEQLAGAIRDLPDKLKSPLIMCVLDGMSQDDCAAILGVSRKTVETRIYRARRKLSDLIA